MAKYVIVKNNIGINYSISQLLKDNPGVAICYPYTGEISEILLKKYNVYPLIECPEIDEEDGYIIEEGSPKNIDGLWIQTWNKKKNKYTINRFYVNS